MSDEGDEKTATSIEVRAPEEGPPEDDLGAASGGEARGAAPKGSGMVASTIGRARDWYRGRDMRDRLVILIGFLVILISIVLLAIWTTGGGFGGGSGPGVTTVPVDQWDRSGLSMETVENEGENSNLEGQETPYQEPFTPKVGEVYFINRLHLHVTWEDETSPPTNVPAVGYVNQPDSFQLIIRIEDALGEWQSELVYNSIDSPGEIDLAVDLVQEMGAPIAVANPLGAKFLPEGHVQNLRVDLVVYTGDCGDWTTDDPRPPIGDGGNHFAFDYGLEFQLDSTTRDPR